MWKMSIYVTRFIFATSTAQHKFTHRLEADMYMLGEQKAEIGSAIIRRFFVVLEG